MHLAKGLPGINQGFMKSTHVFLLAGVALLAVSCTAEMRQNLETEPVAYGPLNHLVVVADSSLWASEVGDTFDYYFAGAYPILPQPEPIFDLRYFTPEELMGADERRELRTYIFLADLQQKDSPVTRLVEADMGLEKVEEARKEKGFKITLAKDKWAKGQLLIYMAGNDRAALIASIKSQYTAVIQRIRKEEEGRLDAGIYLGGTNDTLQEELRLKLGVTMKVPADYFRAMDNPENRIMWLRKETKGLSSNIMIQVLPYTDKSQLSKEGIKAIREKLGKYVGSEISNTYMVTNDVDLPMLSSAGTFHNFYSVEARGIWEMENDYMGGPFIGILVHNPNNNLLYYLEGFIYAPSESKREIMQEVEHVIRTARF